MPTTSYVIALGSNRRHGRYGRPEKVIAAAIDRLRREGLDVRRVSPVLRTPALGPAGRAFANAAAIVDTSRAPGELLAILKQVEVNFGRRRGRRWGPRVLDLDIILWSAGAVRTKRLVIPHPEFKRRRFVLDPVAAIAADWCDPTSGRSIRQLRARLCRPTPVDPEPRGQ